MLYAILIVLIALYFFANYHMMVLWYMENPLDGKQIARKIQVGIPPELD